jgi:hypothetical protein
MTCRTLLTGAMAGVLSATNAMSGPVSSSEPATLASLQDPAQVSSDAQLRRLPSTAYSGVVRLGYAAAGDSPAVAYTPSTRPCSLNSGAGDGGSQIPSADGKCWIWSPPSGGVSPTVFGAIGDGVRDDTAAVQAAVDAAAAAGVPLRFDSIHLYVIGSPIRITSPVDIEGPFRYGVWAVNQPAGDGPQKCPWGLVTRNTGITMINASAITGTIRGLCIDMTGDQLRQPGAGAAINLTPSDGGRYSSGWDIEQNTILQPYDGIRLGYDAGVLTACCGAGTTADGDVVSHNTIVDPAHDGISNGYGTAGTVGGPATVGITVWDNDIVCGKGGLSRGHAGIAVYEGAIWYDGSENGPEGCNIGTLVAPGVISGHQQSVEFHGDGVFGDQSPKHDLLIKPQGGFVSFVSIGGKHPWANATGDVNSVLVDCTVSGSSCQNFTFGGFTVHGGSGQSRPIFDVEGGGGGPYLLSITGSDICQQGTPAAGAIALKLNQGSVSSAAVGRWVISGNLIGTGCPGSADAVGISLTVNSTAAGAANGAVTIVGNDLSAVTRPISYTPSSANDRVIFQGNLGVDDDWPTVGVAGGALVIPDAASTVVVASTGTLSTVNGAYAGRKVDLIAKASGGFRLATGGNICAGASVAQGRVVTLVWRAGGVCWSVH